MDVHDFKHLTPGGEYRVIQAFTDFDGQAHPVGERWRFLGSSFLPYDDGLSLFLSIQEEGGGWRDRQIRMRWIDGDQGEIIDHLRDYVAAA